jgi:hypothetical protein
MKDSQSLVLIVQNRVIKYVTVLIKGPHTQDQQDTIEGHGHPWYRMANRTRVLE